MLGGAVDSGVLGFAPPFFKRQVNEYWLGKYRAWFYGSGFGWQIGAGVTTYIMTAAVFVTVAFGALSAGPWAALAIGVMFGLAAVSRCCSPLACAPPPSSTRCTAGSTRWASRCGVR